MWPTHVMRLRQAEVHLFGVDGKGANGEANGAKLLDLLKTLEQRPAVGGSRVEKNSRLGSFMILYDPEFHLFMTLCTLFSGGLRS